MNHRRPLLVALSLALAGVAWGQSSGPCYFGECEPAAPRREPVSPAPTPMPLPSPGPAPVPTPSPAPRRSEPPARLPQPIPQFFARNVCFRGNAAVPVDDAQTCDRIYNNWGARRTDGAPVECGLITRSAGELGVRIIYTQTVGQCFDMRETMPSNQTYGRCATKFPQGFVHWRRDLLEQECLDPSNPAIVLRP